MKTLRLLCLVLGPLASCFPLSVVSGCSTPPSARVVQVQTLKTVGAGVQTSMRVAAQLLRDQHITPAQWQRLADFHDRQFQPAYNLAVAAVQADLTSVASPELLALFGQLLAIVETFTPRKS